MAVLIPCLQSRFTNFNGRNACFSSIVQASLSRPTHTREGLEAEAELE